MATFQYKPLLERDSLRLLLLQPAPDLISDIRCSLLHTTLADCANDIIDQYTAISYVWGEPNPQERVLVDGQPYQITRNLFHALRDLRDAQRVHRLWVDAICINQSDNQERNQQVGIMGSIYSLAQHTVIYLGGRSDFSDVVLKDLQGFLTGSTAGPDLLALATSEILSRPWFTRVWVYQELVLSRDPWIQLGTSRMKWNNFCNRLKSLQQPPVLVSHTTMSSRITLLQSPQSNSGTQQAQGRSSLPPYVHREKDYYKVLEDMQATRKKFQLRTLDPKIKVTSLPEIIRSRRGFGATDARDMVFGHFGIAADSARDLRISINYDMSVAQIFTQLAQSIIVESRSLGILQHVEDVDSSLRRQGMPSWVPDWTSTGYHDPHFLFDEEKKLGEYSVWGHAYFGLDSNHPTVQIWDENPAVLAINGYFLGSIATTSPIINWSDLDTISFQDAVYGGYYDELRRKAGFEGIPHFDNYKEAIWEGTRDANAIFGISGTGYPHSLASILLRYRLGDKRLVGRRIASFSDGKVAIVPASSLPGDLVCYMVERYGQEHNCILRPKHNTPRTDLDRKVVQEFYEDWKDLKYEYSYGGRREFFSMLSDALKLSETDMLSGPFPTTHVTFVGESFIDKQIWKNDDVGERRKISTLFIIH